MIGHQAKNKGSGELCPPVGGSNITKASEYQPDPKPGNIIVKDYVISDIMERVNAGFKKYGCYLQTENGRDALWDAYQEAIDLVMYIRQAILERDADPNRKG